MLSILLEYLLNSKKNEHLRHFIIRNSFFFFNGVLVGIMLNDVLRLLFAEFEHKEMLEYSVSGMTAASGHVFDLPLLNNKENNLSLGSGMILGTFWANMTEEQQPTSLINPTKNRGINLST